LLRHVQQEAAAAAAEVILQEGILPAAGAVGVIMWAAARHQARRLVVQWAAAA